MILIVSSSTVTSPENKLMGRTVAMKISFTVGIISLLMLVLVIFSCEKSDTSPKTNESGQMRIAFDNVVGTSDMSLNKGTYQNAAGESFAITKFNYFVSNIRLRKADGSEYFVPQDKSYFLI